MNRTIVTLVGKDMVGIIAKVCTYFAENNINILDISQTTVQDYINMMMIVDTSKTGKSFSQMTDELDEIGERIGCIIKAQHEEIFNMMHRV
ncbi:MAG: ACT domain-containing protein [Candidatus Methanomethylophilaceae archaeon]|jgi:ACT domain-containing protein|nr:ACT domain-containing protein [Candidatus Methanomethylophilaceae archaeon]